VDLVYRVIGTDADSITWWQMVIRGVVIFFYTLLLVRLAGHRIFGKYTSFDIILGVILGSIMSRALTGNAEFFPTLAAATALMILHWLMAAISRHSRSFGLLVKGTEVQLVAEGRIDEDALRRVNLSVHDLEEALRARGGVNNIERVKAAYLERSGEVSVVVH